MVVALRFLRSIRTPLITTTASVFSLSRNTIHGYSHPLKSWMKGFEPASHNQVSRLWKLNTHKIYTSPGSMVKFGSILGTSVLLGSVITFNTPIAHAMEVDVRTLPDEHVRVLRYLWVEEETPSIWDFVKYFCLPLVLFVKVLENLDNPLVLIFKVMTLLLISKPMPLSVYLYIEKLRREAVFKDIIQKNFRTLYARQVEAEDYMILCLAKFEFRGQAYDAIGILGNWWALPSLSTVQNFITELRKPIPCNKETNLVV